MIPKNLKLIISPGSNILLGQNVSIISHSPVKAEGTEYSKIKFKSLDSQKPWGSFAVIASEKSFFNYVEFDNGKDDIISGLFSSGMLSIYSTDVEIKNSKFSSANGDDSLNVKNAHAIILDNEFYKNNFDAIDFDFVEGYIENNKFIDNGNDAIDTSGSEIFVKNNFIQNSGDKCISIGEKSTLTIFNNILLGCNTGIAIKDLSEGYIYNNVLYNNLTGLDLYMKKDFFGGGKARVVNTIVWGGDKKINLDNFSSVDISYSVIEGGYQGDKNIDILPDFVNTNQNNYLIKESQKELFFGGNKEILKDIIKDNINNVSIGLYE